MAQGLFRGKLQPLRRADCTIPRESCTDAFPGLGKQEGEAKFWALGKRGEIGIVPSGD